MSDGVRLAATLHFPEGDEHPAPWPAVLEALPYRKDDVTAHYDPEYTRLADEGGYVVCRVDVRGTGTSEGIATDEYPTVERSDMNEVIAWLASQEWSLGTVGMYGTSYSGFNSLQVAMTRPPALKAIISIYATDSRYTDDVHFGGGAARGVDLVDYPSYMIAMNALPPVPSIYGDAWRDLWRKRFDEGEPWVLNWLEHQDEDDYWMQGSLKADYSAIGCPTFVIAGWADGYHNMAFRTIENVKPFSKLLAGPWSHMDPGNSIPGPWIDVVPEMTKWWDRWLRGVENGVEEEPRIQVFMRRPTHPEPDLREHRGEWRSEPVWPVERSRIVSYPLGEGADELQVRGDVGFYASIWCAGTFPWGPPMDQRPDEALSLVYDLTEPLSEEIEVLGHPLLRARVRSSTPIAYLSAKLCDVFPDGTSALVSRGILNLTHRESMSDPTPLEPGVAYDVEFELDATAWIFEEGHRIRLDIAGADWPSTFAPPYAGTLTVGRDETSLDLPELHGEPVAPPPAFQPSKISPAAGDDRGASRVVWRLEHDVLARERRAVVDYPSEVDLSAVPILEDHYGGTISVSTVDPAISWCETVSRFKMTWPEATVDVKSRLRLDSDLRTYRVLVELEASEDGGETWERRWEREIPRHLQ
jgi:predicted acyl esterase